MAIPTIASAQNTGIAGVVRDTSGAVIPGVTVEAASPALIEKVRSVVTDERGLYSIVDLRPGLYTVTFTLPGFSTVKREGIELTGSFTATVNAELRSAQSRRPSRFQDSLRSSTRATSSAAGAVGRDQRSAAHRTQHSVRCPRSSPASRWRPVGVRRDTTSPARATCVERARFTAGGPATTSCSSTARRSRSRATAPSRPSR